MEILRKATSVQFLPTVTHDPSARQESVSRFVRRGRDEQGFPYFPALPDDEGCAGQCSGGQEYHDASYRASFLKNKFSHVHEGGQYLCYGVHGRARRSAGQRDAYLARLQREFNK